MATASNITNVEYRKKLFTMSDAHPMALNTCMLAAFGPSYLGWEAETCWDEIRYTFGVTASDSCKQKIQAIRTIYVADRALSEWEVFELVAAGLVGIAPRIETIQRPTPGRAHVALDVINSIRPGEVQEEVYKYCAAVLMDHGLLYGPGSLEPANTFVPADATTRLQVKNIVDSGRLPRTFASGDVVAVQSIKSMSVKDFAAETRSLLVEQLSRLRS